MSDITDRLKELAHAAADQNWGEFSMRVPADHTRDADLVLLAASKEITRLRAELESVKQVARNYSQMWADVSGELATVKSERDGAELMSLALNSKLAECRNDAERYRFIKDEHDRRDPVGRVVWKRMGDREGNEWVDLPSGASLNSLIDYEIDAALAGEGENNDGNA